LAGSDNNDMTMLISEHLIKSIIMHYW